VNDASMIVPPVVGKKKKPTVQLGHSSTEAPSVVITSEESPTDPSDAIITNMNLQLPQNIKHINKDYLKNDILKNDKLCFVKLKDLCECYFQHNQLIQLGNLKYSNENDKGTENDVASFFVCIGTKKGYDSVLMDPENKKGFIINEFLFIEKFICSLFK
jgi:HSP90 family molecular chaperone